MSHIYSCDGKAVFSAVISVSRGPLEIIIIWGFGEMSFPIFSVENICAA